MKKYELTEETKTMPGGTVLHRIRAVREFTLSSGLTITPGTLGGWVEKEENLSQEDTCFVYDSACVYGDASVCGNARIYGDARVYGDACVYGNASVYDSACVYGDASVCGNARIYGDARVYGDACVYGNASVFGDALVYGDARVCGNASVFGDTVLRSKANVARTSNYIVAGPAGSRSSFTTYLPEQNIVFCGCFSGTLEQFAAAVEKTHAAAPEHRAAYRAMVAYFTALRQNKNS